MQDMDPYHSPAATNDYRKNLGRDHEKQLRKKFNQNIRSMGVFWLLVAGLCMGGIWLLKDRTGNFAPLAAQLQWSATLMLVLGVAAIFKQMWAIYIGLGLSYLNLLLLFWQFNVCSLIVLVVVIAQCHITISLRGKLRSIGI